MIRFRALLIFGSILILALSTIARMRADEQQLQFQTTVTPSYAPLLTVCRPGRPSCSYPAAPARSRYRCKTAA